VNLTGVVGEIAPGVQAARLAVFGQWDVVAQWCGGTVENFRDSAHGWHSYIAVPQASGGLLKAWEGQWIVRYLDGTFAVFLEQQMPHAALWPSLWAKLAAHDGAGCVCRGEMDVGCRDRDEAEYQARWALRVVVEHLGLVPEVPVAPC
jgi:hypothetical protein